MVELQFAPLLTHVVRCVYVTAVPMELSYGGHSGVEANILSLVLFCAFYGKNKRYLQNIHTDL